jgi:sugar lactone lactonase YvrE
MSQLSVIADYGDLCGEGPIWDVRNTQLYWTDCVGLKFYCYDWSTRTPRVVKEGLEIYGCALNQGGGFVITNTSGIWLWDGEGAPHLVAEELEGCKLQMNDCIADPAGRLLAGTVFYSPSQEYVLGKLICVDTDGTARILDEGIHLANGLGFSPDGGTLYFADSGGRTIFAYDYERGRGTVKNRRVFKLIPASSGLPDGLTVDAEGFIWSAEWYGSRVVRYDPDGKIERQIDTPAKQTSSLAFGGPELTDIFITSAGRSEPMPIMPAGYDPNSGYFGGKLLHTNLGIRGKAEFLADIHTEL